MEVVFKRVFLTTSSVRCLLVRPVLTVFDPVTDQGLKQTLGSVLTYKLHVASTQGVCGRRSKVMRELDYITGYYLMTHHSISHHCTTLTDHSCVHQRHLDTPGCRCSGQWLADRCHWSTGSLYTEFPLETHNTNNTLLLTARRCCHGSFFFVCFGDCSDLFGIFAYGPYG